MCDTRRISARAEEPSRDVTTLRRIEAHLRASGGTHHPTSARGGSGGASPRERRNRVEKMDIVLANGRISARAEEPPDGSGPPSCSGAHLRASGGTMTRPRASPTMRGASPRERRNQEIVEALFRATGRISARAEEPTECCPSCRARAAHLRASGGTNLVAKINTHPRGASPRERRNQSQSRWRRAPCRRISARAEEPYSDNRMPTCYGAHLRASGGTADRILHRFHREGASPRERRNHPSLPPR